MGFEVAYTGRRVFEITYAGQKMRVAIPERNLDAVMTIKSQPALPNLKQAVRDAVEEPVGGPKLSELAKPGVKVCLMTIDRVPGAIKQMNRAVLDVLNDLGVENRDIKLLYAAGTHLGRKPPPIGDDRVGSGVTGQVKVVPHNAYAASGWSYRGVTSRGTPVWVNEHVAKADLRVGIGEVAPHWIAGFMGGSKVILPGVSAWDTIWRNHMMALTPEPLMGKTEGNPLREDMSDAAQLAGLDMKIDCLINERQDVVRVMAGDFVKEWKAIIPYSKEIWCPKIPGPLDILVYSPGAGREMSLRSALYPSVIAAELATKRDGIIIPLASCDAHRRMPDPIGDLKYPTEELARQLLHRETHDPLVYALRRSLEHRRVYAVAEALSEEDARKASIAYVASTLDEALRKAFDELGTDARVGMLLQEGQIMRHMPVVQ
ncbi:MAG: lactate racemase domain-containing protein [Candidatus Bathyarchaeia archaeon]